jgi:hypothetical protein
MANNTFQPDGTSMPPSNQVKKVVPNGAKIYRQPNTSPTVGGKMNAALGANLPAGRPRKPPTLGTKLK